MNEIVIGVCIVCSFLVIYCLVYDDIGNDDDGDDLLPPPPEE